MKVSIIACVAQNNVIGKGGKMPWDLPADLRRFREITMGKPVIMGGKTYDSIGGFPLEGRLNVILTRRQASFSSFCLIGRGGELTQVLIAPSLEGALKHLMCDKHNEVFVIGGQSVYEQAVPYADRMYITEVYAEFDGDAFFPEFDATEWDRVPPIISTTDQELGFEYCFAEYRRK